MRDQVETASTFTGYAGSQHPGAAALLSRTSKPRLAELADRVQMLNERASQMLKAASAELDRIGGEGSPECSSAEVNPERYPSDLAVVETGIDNLSDTINRLNDQISRLRGL